MFTRFNPGTVEQVMQIHRKSQAVDGILYYGKDRDGLLHVYKGTHEGRVKEETDLSKAELNIDINIEDIDDNSETIKDHEDRIEYLEKNKIDTCKAIAMSIVL